MTTKSSKLTRRLSILAVILGLGVVGLRAACNSLNPCANAVTARVASPSGNKSLVVFIRDCGATTSGSAQVSLLDENGELPNAPGNLLIIGVQGGPFCKSAHVQWQSESAASIAYPVNSEVFTQVSELNGVSLTYREE